MIYALISDVHANIHALDAVLAAIREIKADQIVCLGDVVGYNAAPNECVERIRGLEIPTVCGNHDAVACGVDDATGFNPMAYSAVSWTRDQLTQENTDWLAQLPGSIEMADFLAAHGSPTDRDTYLFTWHDVLPHMRHVAGLNYRVCFFGHTHSPGIFSEDGDYVIREEEPFNVGDGKVYFINPGSVGQPRDGDPRAAFGVYDTASESYMMVRVQYPVDEAAEAIMNAELPEYLAKRLYMGR